MFRKVYKGTAATPTLRADKRVIDVEIYLAKARTDVRLGSRTLTYDDRDNLKQFARDVLVRRTVGNCDSFTKGIMARWPREKMVDGTGKGLGYATTHGSS
jgi:hypothetical protein